MLQIHHAEDDTQSPSKAYADACWRQDPRLSPDWWREALGHTVGKLALDWRQGVFQPEHLQTGCNLILTSPQTSAAARAAVPPSLSPMSVLEVLITSNPAALSGSPPPFLVWQTETPDLATLIQLENKVKSGEIEAYGLSFKTLPQPAVHEWLTLAAQAAEVAWSRKKRPSLKLLHLPLDITDLSALTEHSEVHKEQKVSLLELAARLNLAVIVSPSPEPDADDEAIDFMIETAHLEQQLNQSLNGWPQVSGQTLFSLLAHLSTGQAPWPTPTHWYNWKNHLWTALQTQWQTVQNPLVPAYLQRLETLARYGEHLAQVAAVPLREALLSRLSEVLPPQWRELEPSTQHLAILSSIPAVTAVAVPARFEPAPLRNLPNIADIGAVLLG